MKGQGIPVDPSSAPPSAPGAGVVRVVEATSWPASRWDSLAATSPFGEAFQSHAWGEAKRPLGWTPRRFVVEAAGEPIAAVSVQQRRLVGRLPGPPGRLCYLYAPRGPVLLRRDPETAAAALGALRRLARSLGAVALTIDPAWEEGSPLASALDVAGFSPSPREVQVSRTVMLVPLDRDEVRQHRILGDSTARNINKARRAGVTVERVDLSRQDVREPALDAFWEMFVATARREGFLVRDRGYQLAQWRLLGDAELATLWFAWANGARQNGVLTLRCGDRLVSHQAGSPDDADLRSTRANHLLQWEIIRWAAGAGFAEYDLGGVDTRDAPGVPADRDHPLWNLFEFKRGFGARPGILVRARDYAPRALLGTGWRMARRLR